MALVRKSAPRDPALDDTDYTNLVVLQATDLLQANGPHNYIDLVNDLVLEGAVFNVGGTIYLADDDTAISGTPSPYVAIIPSGATAVAAYVADLTGVSWDGAYNGWYDGSGNLYIFDEAAALAAGEISELHQKSPIMTTDGGVAYKGLGDVGKLILLKSYVFDEAGTDTISVPAGSITVEAVMLSGGGGGGGGEDGNSGSFTGGKGGGGGAAGNFRAVRVPCFGLSTISYVVGAGGARGTAVGGSSGANGANGSPGGDTSITVDSITYSAPGGLGGGGGGIGGAVGVGGAAGSYVEADIDIAIVNGKAGQNGLTNSGASGGGGGIGGALLNSGAAGGGAELSMTSISLGMYINYAGGAGGAANTNGSPGEIACGGGGGGGGGANSPGRNGGNGGRGRLIIKFYGIPQ